MQHKRSKKDDPVDDVTHWVSNMPEEKRDESKEKESTETDSKASGDS